MSVATSNQVNQYILQPTGDRIQVQNLPAEEISAGGIHIPQSSQVAKTAVAQVVAVGPGAFDKDGNHRAMPYKPGDYIVYGKYVGSEIKLNGIDYMILRDSEVFGILQPPKK